MTLNRQLLFRLLPVVVLPSILLGLATFSVLHSFIRDVGQTQVRIATSSSEAEQSGSAMVEVFESMQDRQNAFALANTARLLDTQVTQMEDVMMVMAKQQSFAIYMRGSPGMRESMKPVITRFFEELIERYPCTEMSLLDSEGQELLRVSERIAVPGENPFAKGFWWGNQDPDESKTRWFLRRANSQDPITRTVDWAGRDSGPADEPSLTLAAPMKFLGINYSQSVGTDYGFIRMVIPLSRLVSIIPNDTFKEGTFALRPSRVHDQGNVIFQAGLPGALEGRDEIGVHSLKLQNVQLVLFVDQSALYTSIDQVNSANSERSQSIEDLEKHVREMIAQSSNWSWWFAIGIVLITLLAGLTVAWVSRSVTQPIVDIERAAARIREGQHDQAVHIHTSVSEVKQLGESLDAMRKQLLQEILNRDAKVRMRTIDLEKLNQLLRGEVEERRRAEEAARASSRAKSDFVATISHEIRTPLNGVIGSIELLRQSTEITPEEQELLDMAESSGRLLLEVVNEVLDFSRIEAGRMQLESMPFDCNQLVRDLKQLFAPQLNIKGLFFKATLHPSADRSFLGDEIRIKQVLVNLLGNAIKFTETGGVHFRIRYNPSHQRLHMLIADSGPGIPKDRLTHIFEPFEQLDSSRTRRYGGTGLGLAICFRLIELMGGKITVRSRPEVGTAFRLSIPLPIVATNGTPAERHRHASGENTPPRRILVAEDNAMNQRIVQRLLEKRGHGVIIASNGQEALTILEEQDVDLVLLDIHMPVLDGIETARQFRNRGLSTRNAGVHIIALTANAAEADRNAALSAGMNGFLTKPIRMDTLIATVEKESIKLNPESV